MKHFEISVLRHIRFAELRKTIEQPPLTSQVKSKYFYSLKVKYNMTSEEMEIQSCSQDGNRNFIYIITVG